jgi:hypothetical protein
MILWHITAAGAIGAAGCDNVLTANRRGVKVRSETDREAGLGHASPAGAFN